MRILVCSFRFQSCFEPLELQQLHTDVRALLDAIGTLEDAIHKIDLETRDLLGATFNTVNEHFGRMFPSLFGGGSVFCSGRLLGFVLGPMLKRRFENTLVP